MRRLAAITLAALCALALGACASTLQSAPIPHNLLEGLVESRYTVYWLGGSFEGMPVFEATHDRSASYSILYGNCLVGGEGGCVPPLRIVTSPDNSFLPGASASARAARIRGVPALLALGGRTIVLATGGVVVDVYARDASLALAAARTLVPINAPGALGAPLPAPLPNTGFGEAPLPAQVPPPLRALSG